jgi:uncharacterized protein
MSVSLGYPGVRIREVQPSARSISGVATSITAFIGRAPRGTVQNPVTVRNFGDYERRFGGLSVDSMMGYAVRQFFLNGGSEALIVRLFHATEPEEEDGNGDGDGEENGNGNGDGDGDHADGIARVELDPPTDNGSPLGSALLLRAENPGAWGNRLRAIVDHDTRDDDDDLFNLHIEEVEGSGTTLRVVQSEEHRNLSVDPNSARYYREVLENTSNLVRDDSQADPPTSRPAETGDDGETFSGGNDGENITDGDVTANGLPALDDADLFNLLCIPPLAEDADILPNTWSEAAAYCEGRRAMLLIDPPSAWNEPDDITAASVTNQVVNRSANAALYFPRIRAADPLKENRPGTFVPCGAVAGVIARTDANRGVWKSPAGQEATLVGVTELEVKMTDDEQSTPNQLGVNCLRSFPVAGRVVWGARTLRGADSLADQWKYLAVRRLALYIQESLYRGTQWVVFEPNDEPLWSQIRLTLGTFMHDLFRQGAFQGTSPSDAYFVKCDSETTTQSDIDRGIVNIIVGFAPLKPAEFVFIYIQQIAQQAEL